MADNQKAGGVHILGISLLLFILLFSGVVSAASLSVDAGTDKIEGSVFFQNATAFDDITGIANYSWTMESGPGNVTFSANSSEDTDVSADTEGNYVIRLTVFDNANNSAFDEFTLVWDTTAPVITVPGNIIANATNLSGTIGAIVEFNVSALDNFDGDLAVSCFWNSGEIFSLGTTTNTCEATDNASNTAFAAFNITVLDSAPVITLLGDSVVNIITGSEYNDSGATAFDNIDGNLTANITSTSTVNTNVAGTYNVSFNVNDSANNSAVQVTRTVNVNNPPSTGGGGGGGGGGGSKKNCVENWQCGSWTECNPTSGARTRVCVDLKNCGTLEKRPEILEDCATASSGTETVALTGSSVKEETIPQETKGAGFIGRATGSVIGAFGTGGTLVALIFVVVLAAALIVFMIVLYRQKRMEYIDRDVRKYIGTSDYNY